MKEETNYKIILLLCFAEILGISSVAVFPALLPNFFEVWSLTNTEAGWINSSYYGGYIIFALFVISLTDRLDTKKIFLAGMLLGGLSSFAFSFLGNDFWSAFLFRFLAGISLACIFMPGLKLVSDSAMGKSQSRFVSFYTASFSIGFSLSFLMAGEINTIANWRWAFCFAGFSNIFSAIIVFIFVPSEGVKKKKRISLFKDFKIVLKSKEILGYVLCYGLHMWELFSFRAWLVTFLTFTLKSQQNNHFNWSPTQIAFIVNLVAVPASIIGNEMSIKFGRIKVISIIMITSVGIALILGFNVSSNYLTVSIITICYGITTAFDSGSLTAGAVASAADGVRGTTLAVYSTIGFGAAFLGPLFIGVILDLFGSDEVGWGFGFISMAGVTLLGPFLLYYLQR